MQRLLQSRSGSRRRTPPPPEVNETYRALASAFLEAAETGTAGLLPALSARRGRIDLETGLRALDALAALAARASGETPRAVFEGAFFRSPRDEYWEALVGARTLDADAPLARDAGIWMRGLAARRGRRGGGD